jgi:hypothetical protein
MVAKHLQVCFVQNSIEALFLASAFEISIETQDAPPQ